MDAKMIATSKWLAYVLRHRGAADLGLQKRPGGWLKLAELEAAGRSSAAELLVLLQSDGAGRFQAFCNRGEFWVRAAPSTPLGGGHATPQTPPSLGPHSPVWRGEWVGQW
jgi:RNA:NAD 2'-phosphotransferase (TPT1/KptA family)